MGFLFSITTANTIGIEASVHLHRVVNDDWYLIIITWHCLAIATTFFACSK